MAQMPVSYLEEKVAELDRDWTALDAAGRGVIELDERTRRHLAHMALQAQAIVREIAEWTGVDA